VQAGALIMKAWGSSRRFARAVFHSTDRIAHPIRRRRTVRTLGNRGWPRSILFVCHGNICRSPYAAAAFERALPAALRSNMRIGSAGFIGPNRPAPSESLIVASRRGLDLSSHLSAQLSHDNIRNAELIVVMNAAQQRALIELYGRKPDTVVVLGDLDPQAIDTRAIRDPIGQSEEVFEASYDRIDRCLKELVSAFAPDELADAPSAARSA
jgi:protein-tyrosine phosphatase